MRRCRQCPEPASATDRTHRRSLFPVACLGAVGKTRPVQIEDCVSNFGPTWRRGSPPNYVPLTFVAVRTPPVYIGFFHPSCLFLFSNVRYYPRPMLGWRMARKVKRLSDRTVRTIGKAGRPADGDRLYLVVKPRGVNAGRSCSDGTESSRKWAWAGCLAFS